ncbi:MAG: hemolysin III family protein [Actinomycetota bacterium]|nr:hemolysin III family protein [Actinomycetota bacterium]
MNEPSEALREVLTGVRPRLRGRLHQVVFFVSIPAGFAMVAAARSPSARLGAVVYAVSLTALFGTSAAYHRLAQTLRARLWMRRLDHSMIFVLIAGTYTPVCLLVLDGALRTVTLSVVWAAALAGVALKVFRHEAVLTGNSLYLVMGWSVVLILPQLARRLETVPLALLVAGGLLYTVGVVVLSRHRPDPFPTVFGYHEIWHALVVVASVCHYVMILALVRSA